MKIKVLHNDIIPQTEKTHIRALLKKYPQPTWGLEGITCRVNRKTYSITYSPLSKIYTARITETDNSLVLSSTKKRFRTVSFIIS